MQCIREWKRIRESEESRTDEARVRVLAYSSHERTDQDDQRYFWCRSRVSEVTWLMMTYYIYLHN